MIHDGIWIVDVPGVLLWLFSGGLWWFLIRLNNMTSPYQIQSLCFTMLVLQWFGFC